MTCQTRTEELELGHLEPSIFDKARPLIMSFAMNDELKPRKKLVAPAPNSCKLFQERSANFAPNIVS